MIPALKMDRVRGLPPSATYKPMVPERPATRPPWNPASFSAIAVLVAVLPGLFGLKNWDLNPPGPWWGIRALEIVRGRMLDQVTASGIGSPAETRLYRSVAMQPPLFAYLEAIALVVFPDRAPVATVIPSYVSGAICVYLVFLLARAWGGAAVGMIAAILFGSNRHLLIQMQQATPTTLGLAGALAALVCYQQTINRMHGVAWRWVVAGGCALALSLLSVGVFGLVLVPVLTLHGIANWAARSERRWSRARKRPQINPWVLGTVCLCALGIGLALPWYRFMFSRYGLEFRIALFMPPQSSIPLGEQLMARLLELAPLSVPLAFAGMILFANSYLSRDWAIHQVRGGALAISCFAAAAIVPAVLSHGTRPALSLFLCVPLSYFAAVTIVELAARRLPFHTIVLLAPMTALAATWYWSSQLREGMSMIAHRRPIEASGFCGLLVGAGLIVALGAGCLLLERWARHRDDRKRTISRLFLSLVIVMSLAIGIKEVGFRHRETKDLLTLRSAILRRHRDRPFSVVAVVGPERQLITSTGIMPGGRVRFMLRSALPNLAQIDVASIEQLRTLPPGDRLVLLLGAEHRMSYGDQSRLNLEALASGQGEIESAFATVFEAARRERRVSARGVDWVY